MDPNITDSSRPSLTPWGPRLKFKIPTTAKPKVPLTDGGESALVNRVAGETLKEPKLLSSAAPIHASVSHEDDMSGIRPKTVDKSVNQSEPSQLQNTIASDLLAATRDKDDADVRKFLSHFDPRDVNGLDSRGHTPLTRAVVEGDLRMIRLLKERGADINGHNDGGWTPITIAVNQGNSQMVDLLVKEFGADVKRSNGRGHSPLTLAVAANNYAMIEKLQELGADINESNGSGWTPMTIAVNQGNSQMVKQLKSFGADVNRSNRNGQSPLTLAVAANNYNMVKLLHELEADINGLSDEGWTPMTFAVNQGNSQMVEALAKLGVYIHGSNSDGYSPIVLATALNNHDMIKQLKRLGADINAFSSCGLTPLSIAVLQDNSQMVEMLVEDLKADINGFSGSGQTPLTVAVLSNNFAMIDLLIKHQADINAAMDGFSPLFHAVTQGDGKMAELLVKDLGADVNKVDGRGQSPLFVAIGAGDIKMVELLVKDLGADVNVINKEGWSPLNLSIGKGNSQMTALLKNLGAEENLEILERKFLAHTWGMNGTFEYQLRGTDKLVTVSYEAHSDHYCVKKLAEYSRTFFDDPKRSGIPTDDKTDILNAIENGYPLSKESAEEMAARIQRGEPLVISNGLSNHAIAMVLCKGKLAICNRGLGARENAVEFYDLPREEVTAEIIEKLAKGYPDIQSFNEMLAGLSLPSSGGYRQKYQKVGNCTWASPKGAFGALCHLYFGEEMGRQLYKEFTAYTRKRSLEDYQQKYQESTSYDTDLLRRIGKKQEKKGINISKLPDSGQATSAASAA